MTTRSSLAEKLCLTCGLCCNGVIFADVQLQSADDHARLRALGLVTAPATGKKSKAPTAKMKQPCGAFGDCCGVYEHRPKYCREFECLLLQTALAGNIAEPAAQRIIRTARRRADRVRKLLRELGDTREKLALSKRFRRVQKRMETHPFEREAADTFGELTLAVHDLNCLLSDAFYPGR
jgi:uncharacterized protein